MSQETINNSNLIVLLNTVLRQVLSKHIISVVFTKADGTERTMVCTNDKKVLNENLEYQKFMESYNPSKKVKRDNPEVISVWDLEKNAFRSFNITRIKSITIS